MTFVHDDPEFEQLLRIVAEKRKLPAGFVEKDYWVTHALWWLHEVGFDVWFKGGTSLSKGFALIERFSEDLDLKIESGRVTRLPSVPSWKSKGTAAVDARRAYFEALAAAVIVPGACGPATLEDADEIWRNADVRVAYPGKYLGELAGIVSEGVKLEVGDARVTPFVVVDLSSFVHDELAAQGQLGDFDDNRPRGVRCVHPIVTLIEKLDAVHLRFAKGKAPAGFVRHFEDAARVIGAAEELPRPDGYETIAALARDMLAQKQIAVLPSAANAAFAPDDGQAWSGLRDAHAKIGPMYWGDRIGLEDACERIRSWIAEHVSTG